MFKTEGTVEIKSTVPLSKFSEKKYLRTGAPDV